MDDLSLFCCQNPDCPDYGLRGRDNLRVGFRYGPAKQRRMLVCRSCQTRFSERKGTAFFGSRLSDDRAVAVFAHLQDGCGIRQTGRLVGVDKDTVVRYALRAGQHAQPSHDELVAFSPTSQEIELDEKWSFVTKKQKHCQPGENRCGDCWDHVALDVASRLVLSVVVGKRTEAHACQVVHEMSRTDGRPLNLITSDEYAPYAPAIAAVDAVPAPEGETVPDTERLPEWLVYATVHKTRENNRVVKVESRLVFGTLVSLAAALVWTMLGIVSTVFIERSNGTDRLNNSSR